MKKSILAILIALTLLFGMLPMSAMASSELTDVYVAATGVDTNAGTAEAPVQSLNKALELVQNGGTVHIVDTYTVAAGFVWENHNKAVTITGGKLDISGAYVEEQDGERIRQCFYQGDAVTYDNIELIVAEGAFYFANGNRLQVNENVTITGGMKLFGGSFKKNVSGTDMKLLGGSYLSIYGGGYKGHVTDDIQLYIGGVNPGYTATHDGSTLLYGGGYNCNVYGDVNLTIADGNVDFAYGASHNSGIISGDVNVLVAGGSLYSLYGGGNGTIKGDINLTMTGGTVAQLIGANKKTNYTGNVSVMLKGGTLTRRFFGGCYNDYDVLGSYTEHTYVKGNVNVYLSKEMNLEWNKEETDNGFYAHSRHNPLFEEEVTNLYYMDAEAQTKHQGNIGAQNTVMGMAMGSAAAADNISLLSVTTNVEKWNIILGDSIGVRFYVNVPKVIADIAQLKVTVDGKTELINLTAYTPNDLGQYMIPVSLAAAQMTEEVTLQLVVAGVEGDSVSYTVQEYAQTILAGEYDEETKTLVRHMLNYGAAAQNVFDINTNNLANAGVELDYTAQLPEGYEAMEVKGGIKGVSYYGAALVMENKIALRYYFNAESIEGVIFTANGKSYEPVEKNGQYYVEISGINPQAYADITTLTAVKGEETLEVSYSPMHYIVRMSEKGDAELKAMVNALYGYYEAAYNYVEKDEELSDVIDWTSAIELPTEAGKYRLTTNVDVSKATTTAKYAEIYLDLNGKTVTGAEGTRIYVVDEGAELTVTDTSGQGGMIVCNRTNVDADAGAIYVKGAGATFNLEGGIIDASNVNVKTGAAVYVAAGAAFNMSDGTITGGTAATNGGNIYVQAATNDVATPGALHISGGMVTVGKAAQGGNIYVAAGNNEQGKAAATFLLEGGMISDGEATTVAGNVASLGAMTMTGGEIVDGVCLVSTDHKYAANLYTRPGLNGGSFSMTGGTIAGGVRVNNAGGAISLGGTAKIVGGTTNLTISAGTMTTTGFSSGAEISVNHTELGVENTFGTIGAEGDEAYIKADNGKLVSATAEGKLFLEDINLWTSTDSLPTKSGRYRLAAPVTVSKATTITGQEIYLDLSGQTITGTNNVRIFVLNEGAELTIDDTATGGKIICAREATGNAGAIYLNKPSATFNLNGGTIDVSATSVEYGAGVYVAAGNTFTMNGGTITGGTATANGGNVYVSAATNDVKTPGVFTMNGGTITEGTARQGGNIYVAAGGSEKAAAQFAMNDGTISAGEATAAAGNVAALGEFTMIDGEITGGICDVDGDHKYGANLYTRPGLNGCTFTMTGGTIAGGVRVNNAGGAISLGGTAKIVGGKTGLTFSAGTMTTTGFSEGAEISVNTLTYGIENSFGTVGAAGDLAYIKADNGNYVTATAEGKLYAKDFKPWTSTTKLPTAPGRYGLAAPVTVSAATTITGKEVYLDLNGQTITGTNNARIFVLNEGAELTIDDTATGGKIICARVNTGNAGAIYLNKASATFNLNGGTIDVSATTVEYGAGVYVAAGNTFNMNGGTITGGTATVNGGNVYVAATGTFTMNAGTITGGNATEYGGNVYVAEGGTATMAGGMITSGEATKNGGNVYVSAATTDVVTPGAFTLEDGTITLGNGVQGGNIYVAAGGTEKAAAQFTMNGGTISVGTASTTGGNVAALGEFTMTDGEITGGICKATTAHKYATNMYVLPGKNGCTFTMTGGTIAGGVRVNNAGTLTLGGTAKITTDANGYGMYVSNNGATIAVDAEKPLVTGAEIWLSETGNDPIIKGNIAAEYQQFFNSCGESTLAFDENGIHAVATQALVLDQSNQFSVVSSKKA